MFKSYLKTALRNILRHKGYSFISITGLTVGMAVFILIIFYVQYEFSYDKFNENYHRICRVEEFYKSNRAYGYFPLTPCPLGPALVQNYPEILNFTRIANVGRRLLSTLDGEKKIYQEEGKYVDRSFFSVFSFPLIKGDPKTALAEVTLPELNILLNTDVGINLSAHWQLILGLIFFVFLMGIFSGSYPAFLLSSFHPVKVLKGVVRSRVKSPVLQRILVIANMIAWPIAYFLMNFFLQQFAFRITLQPWMFLLSGVLVLMVAAVTVCYHTIKAALTNPVEALRYE